MKKLMSLYSQDDCSKHYKIGKTLGTGSFATVKEGISKDDGKRYAIKCIDKAKLGPEDAEALKMEVKVLKMLEHPNVVSLKETYDCNKTFYMVMELMTGGELFDRIVEKEKYTEGEARKVVRKLADALKYCHERNIVHRDLKPENLLYTSKDDSAEIKIADFGLAKLVEGATMMMTACGTPGYVAPEVLEGTSYGKLCDVWSLGVITYILLCGFPPFYEENNAALFASIKAGRYEYPSPYWDEVSSDAKDLINHMLVVKPANRYTMDDVLSHPWVSEDKEYHQRALTRTGAELKRYNARRKFRAGVALVRISIKPKLKKIQTFAASSGTKTAESPTGSEELSSGRHHQTARASLDVSIALKNTILGDNRKTVIPASTLTTSASSTGEGSVTSAAVTTTSSPPSSASSQTSTTIKA